MSHYSVGICLQKLGKSAEAVAEFREAIRLKPDKPGAHGDLAQTFAMMGRSDEARVEYQEAIRLRRAALARTLNRNGAMLLRKRQPSFRRDLLRTTATSPTSCPRKARLAKRRTNCAKPSGLAPEYWRAHGSLGILLCDKKHDYEGAIAAFKAAIQLAPHEGVHYMNLGNAFRGNSAWDEAIAAYQQAIRLKPDDGQDSLAVGTRG